MKTIRNNYSHFVTKEPIDKLPDDVKINDEFKLETYIDGETKEHGAFFVKKTGLADNNGIKVVYSALDPLENWKCGIKTDDI